MSDDIIDEAVIELLQTYQQTVIEDYERLIKVFPNGRLARIPEANLRAMFAHQELVAVANEWLSNQLSSSDRLS